MERKRRKARLRVPIVTIHGMKGSVLVKPDGQVVWLTGPQVPFPPFFTLYYILNYHICRFAWFWEHWSEERRKFPSGQSHHISSPRLPFDWPSGEPFIFLYFR